VAGFAGLIAGLDVKIDLCTLREKLPNVAFEVLGDRMSLRHRQCRRHPKAETNAMETP